jgi:hypothetical protein
VASADVQVTMLDGIDRNRLFAEELVRTLARRGMAPDCATTPEVLTFSPACASPAAS